jgi:dGTPase
MQFNYKNIYNSPIKDQNEKRSTKLFQMLFDKYLEDLNSKKGYIYDEFYLKMVDNYTKSNSYGKIVVDFIAGMTDKFFIEQFEDNFLPASM